MAEQTEKHPNVILLDRFYDAYAREDMAAVREIFAPDIIWRIPGHHPLSGPKHGADEVLAFFDQLAKADFKADVQAISAVDDYVLEFHRGWSDYGPKLDVMWTLVFRFEGECIKEVYNMCADQHAADQFFYAIYRLKPIPDRLDVIEG